MTITDTRAGADSRKGCGCGHCSTCTGLSTFTRPRFFAGQLLTDTELTALMAYTRGKDRLHNRYLHGAGVVCGLAVECDGCGPGVLVQPGYALDGLGNDVVLPDAVAVDVLALIQACTQRQRAQDCDPPRHPTATGCEEGEQCWCLWVRYAEQNGRLVTPLGGPARPSCGCSSGTPSAAPCGCGTATTRTSTIRSSAPRSGGGCGCGGGSRSLGVSTTTTTRTSGGSCGCASSASPTTSVRSGTDCEPSRVSEVVDFGVAQLDCSCEESLGDRLSGTFPAKVAECIAAIRPLLSRGLNRRMQAGALSLVTGGAIGAADGTAREAICTLYANVAELYRRDPLRTQCVLPEELSSIDCSPRGANETEEHLQQRLQAAAYALIQLVLVYLRDCVCAKVLPPCPDDCDDRVMLACVTVRDGRVVRICNLACRRYAGSFVTREYWLPIGPVLSWLAALVCCFPLPTRRLVRDQREVRVARAAAAPPAQPAAAARPEQPVDAEQGEGPTPVRTAMLSGQLDDVISALTGDGFALGTLWKRRAAAVAARLRPRVLLQRVNGTLGEDRDTVALAPLLHADAAEASRDLGKRGVQVRRVEVEERSQALGLDLVPRVRKGGTATLYTLGGVVVGVSGSEPTLSLRDVIRGPMPVADTTPEHPVEPVAEPVAQTVTEAAAEPARATTTRPSTRTPGTRTTTTTTKPTPKKPATRKKPAGKPAAADEPAAGTSAAEPSDPEQPTPKPRARRTATPRTPPTRRRRGGGEQG